MQLDSRGARDPTQLHWTLVRPFASLVNCSHVILNIIRSLKSSTTLRTLETNPVHRLTNTSLNYCITYNVALLFGMRAQMPA